MFFIGVEVFTVLYGQIPAHLEHFAFLFAGLHGEAALVPWAWASLALGAIALVILLVPRARAAEPFLAAACGMVILSVWIDKGLCLIVGGFVPSAFGEVTTYVPTLTETAVTLGVWGLGLLALTVFYKLTLAVRKELPRGA
jgi:molybdopterin-containing oxidoreductase family membrane subunit